MNKNKDALKKEIDYQINIKNNLWTALIVSVSGTLSLLFNTDNITKLIFVIIGLIFTVLFINGYFKRNDIIEDLIKKLNKEEI